MLGKISFIHSSPYHISFIHSSPYHISFIHSSFDGYLGCFHAFAIINNANEHRGACIYFN